jgi:Flp pilus assembly protein CpaB
MPTSTAVRSDVVADGGRRRTISRPVLPSGRSLVGGLLLAVAAVGTFTAWQQASNTPDTSYAVARRLLHPGDRLGPDDVRLVPIELASRLTGQAFTQLDAVIGRVALGPIGPDELIQQGQVSDEPSSVPVVEVSFALPRDRALDGRLRSGDRVDVFATYDDRTEEVVHGVQVVGLGGGGEPSLTPDAQVTVTVALEEIDRRTALVHAVRAGDVTLVRSTGVPTPMTDGRVYRPDDGLPATDRGSGPETTEGGSDAGRNRDEEPGRGD